jgi:excisionase family DNA binding protein
MSRVSPAKLKPGFVRDKRSLSAENSALDRASSGLPRLAYRRDEAAEALGVAVQTIDAWIGSGQLRASKPPGVSGKPGRYILIRAADIEALLTASEIAA